MMFALFLFVVFTVLATGGAFWIGIEHRSRRFAVVAALSTLLVMGALFAALWFWVWPMLTSGTH